MPHSPSPSPSLHRSTAAHTSLNAHTTGFSRRAKVHAWLVHAFTLTGLVWATLAVAALVHGELVWMWLWLGIALIVDGLDGNLARKYRVKDVIPWFSGTIVDHVVDYLTWTAIPVAFMALHLPLGGEVSTIILAIVILVSSMFCYANEAAKSRDNYFVGFPAAWNIVALMLWILEAPMVACIAVIVIFSVMTLVPLHYTHPFRVERGKVANIIATCIWIVTAGLLVASAPGAHAAAWTEIDARAALLGINLASGLWLILGGIRRSLQGR